MLLGILGSDLVLALESSAQKEPQKEERAQNLRLAVSAPRLLCFLFVFGYLHDA